MTNSNKRAVIYARVSGDDSDKDGRNLAGQLEMGKDYCAKRGYRVLAELPEDIKGASGAEIDLPQLTKVREMARAGLFDVLIVRELDRLSRNLAKQLVIEEELKQYGVTIEYLLYDYPDTPEGNLMKHIRASFSEYEREKIRERNMRGKRLKVKAGSVMCSTEKPYGYILVAKERRQMLQINEEEAAIVRLIYEWFTRARIGLREIARRLNEMGVPPPGNSLRPSKKTRRIWRHTSVHVILTNETYAGTWHYGKHHKKKLTPRETWIPVAVPPIIPREQWEIAQRVLQNNKERQARTTKHEHLMTRRIVCTVCKKPMQAYAESRRGADGNRKIWRYYVCYRDRFMQPKAVPGTNHSISGAQVDVLIWDWVKGILLDPERLAKGIEKYQKQQEQVADPIRRQLQITDSLIEKRRAEYSELIDLYLSGEVRRDILTKKKVWFEQTITDLERERVELAEQMESATLTEENIATLEAFAKEVREHIVYGETISKRGGSSSAF